MSGMGKAGAYRPGRLGCTFARVPHDLIAAMLDAGMPIKWAVMLTIMSYCGEDEEGSIWASCARSTVCSALGITERQARTATSSLVSGGMLSVLESGHNGRATVYRLNLKGYPAPIPTTLEPTPKTLEPTPSEGEEASKGERGTPRTSPFSAVGSGPEATPNRTFEEGSYRTPSSKSGPLSMDCSAEGPHEGPRGDDGEYVTDLKPLGADALAGAFMRGSGVDEG